MESQTRNLAGQRPLEMLEANIAELYGQVDDLQSQVNDLRSQVNHLEHESLPTLSDYGQHHIQCLHDLILGVQSQVAINVTPSIDDINRTIGHLQVQFDEATHISDFQTGK